MTFFLNNERIRTLERTSKKGKKPRKEKRHIMEKTTLGKIIKAVRELESKESVNDSQFEFYQKKKRRIEEKRALETSSNIKETIEHYKNNKETLDFCYGFMNKVENENKIINNQIEQYLINYIVIVLVDKLNKMKTFNYKKLDKIFSQTRDYIESHLTKKTITKKFSIDDFSNIINWNMKTVEQEAQDNATIEADLNELKNKIEKLISDYNQKRKKLTINQDSYEYMYIN